MICIANSFFLFFPFFSMLSVTVNKWSSYSLLWLDCLTTTTTLTQFPTWTPAAATGCLCVGLVSCWCWERAMHTLSGLWTLLTYIGERERTERMIVKGNIGKRKESCLGAERGKTVTGLWMWWSNWHELKWLASSSLSLLLSISRPAPGHFNEDGIPDLLIQQSISPGVRKVIIIYSVQ